MLPSKTVFVVGAGASHEVGLPVGSQLKITIANKLDIRFEFPQKQVGKGDDAIHWALSQKFPDEINTYLNACWRIRDGIVLSPSIDDYINMHQHDEYVSVCGKLAIARSILEAERRSSLFFERKNANDTVNFFAIQNTWYAGFYQLLSQGVPKTALGNLFENTTIINFNYDRCLEHFLVHAIARNYHISTEEARTLVEKLTIFHPYGTVGPYFGPLHETVEFGSQRLPAFDTIIKNLKTYSEQVEDQKGLKAIRTAIANAEVLVFLGTAFHPNNMNLLMGEHYFASPAGKRIYATRKGISDADLMVVCKYLAQLCGVGGSKYPKDYNFAEECHQLFDDYRMSMRQ